MAIRLQGMGQRVWVLLGLLALACAPDAAARHRKGSDANAAQKPPAASQPAAMTVPVEQFGFSAPGAFYAGLRESLVSLDFLDENRLLFTFRAPGLIKRAAADEDKPRQIRAVVITLPTGTVESEALWTIHGRGRYLWILDGGKFLLRNGDTLNQVDATLEPKALLRFPGPIEWLEMDPAQRLMVTDSREPVIAKEQPGQVGSPSTAAATVEENEPRRDDAPDMVLRILDRASGQVMLVSRVRAIVHLPISGEGYLEALRGSGRDWALNLNLFAGGSRLMGKVSSTCSPPLVFVRKDVALANACSPQGGRNLVAVNSDGKRIWETASSPTQVWPILVPSPGGARVARETLSVSHAVDAFSPLSFDDVTGQLVEVIDTATGKTLLKAQASPVLDGGGNVAISASGRRVAVLSEGAIQIYELSSP